METSTKRESRVLLVLILATALLAAFAARGYAPVYGAPPDGPGDILVYTGDGAFNEGYADFSAATGRDLDIQAVLPADLDSYACIVLPVNSTGFSDPTEQAFLDYLNGGGRILALAEHSSFPGSIATMNDLAAFIGADLEVTPAFIDPAPPAQDTTNIDAHPFTAGVNTIRYAATSEVEVLVGPAAQSLVRTRDGGAQPGTTFIAVDTIGDGFFILAGDSNPFSDNNGGGYVEADNAVLAFNLCGLVPEIDVDIDIKPGSDPNSINSGSRGVIPVAILGSIDFDVADVEQASLTFGVTGDEDSLRIRGNGMPQCGFEDVNGDGFMDLVCQFNTEAAGFQVGDTEGFLKGETTDGVPINGSDAVRIVR